MAKPWSFWIDVGGTFTDCLARNPNGVVHTHKLLSTGEYRGLVGAGSNRTRIVDPQRRGDPQGFFDAGRDDEIGYRLTLRRPDRQGRVQVLDQQAIRQFDAKEGCFWLDRPLAIDPTPDLAYAVTSGESAPLVGIRWLMGKRIGEPIGPVSVRLGTTRGTNALLERQGAPTALVTTAGFGDVLRIGYQNRPRLFDLHIRLPAPLYDVVVEVAERLDAEGRVLVPLEPDAVRERLAPLRATGIRSLAVCLMHAYRNDVHERCIERVARELGFEQISISSRVSPLPRIVPRGDTTVVDAYLTPVIRDYLDAMRAAMPEATLKVMTSAGGLVDADVFVGKDSILSGPAGGVVGCAHAATQAGFARAIGFDMGGTSTDVSRFDGDFERRYEMQFNDADSDAGVRIVAPMLAIETVAAGGGSICRFDGALPRVGPKSAGADPGPACYGHGGPLTVTDVNLFLGKLLPDHFAFPLDRDAVVARLDELIASMQQAGQVYSREALAEGFNRIANANMAAAIRKISIARGYDPRDYTLVSFGGAGGQHACAVARELGIRTVLLHPHAGVLSAYGIGMADVTRFAARHVGCRYDVDAVRALERVFVEMEAALRSDVLAEDVAPDRIQPPRRRLDLRYTGMAHVITVERGEDDDYLTDFRDRFRRLFGFDRDQPVEIVTARVELTARMPKPTTPRRPVHARRPQPIALTRTCFDGADHETPVHERDQLRPGDHFDGPAIITEKIGTIVVEPGWRAEMTALGDVLLTDSAGPARREAVETEVDLMTLELFNNHFASIAEQMGTTLQKTALSTNVKERLDFSCAIFTAAGDLVVNAPHIPVHLGAMSECVKCLIDDAGAMQPGEVYVTNDPFRGGSHLPDVTVITPVFESAGREILFFTASRAHHAEIGGIMPGSMPPAATNLAQEGVLIRMLRLVADRTSAEAALRAQLSSGPHPSRAVDENIADVNAQVAANALGVRRLLAMVDRYGLAVVHAYMGHIQQAAERKVRRALRRRPAGRHTFSDSLENGAEIRVAVTLTHEGEHAARAVVDFTGTDPVQPDNLNANSAIVSSAVMYCLRCLIDEDIPLNAGVLAPVTIVLPPGCLLNPPAHDDPTRCPAVGGGNVETSQRVVDVVFGALGIVAASQGTMNNLLFGRSDGGDGSGFSYYETIGGGAGAGPTFDGADAVHTHMTNTRLTDPEILESRYPVRVCRFVIRRGSGGAGAHRGGDGIIRELEFLAPLEVSLLTGRRKVGPYGLAGGQAGRAGLNRLLRAGSQRIEPLAAIAALQVKPGDVLTIETPGGGGYGTPLCD